MTGPEHPDSMFDGLATRLQLVVDSFASWTDVARFPLVTRLAADAADWMIDVCGLGDAHAQVTVVEQGGAIRTRSFERASEADLRLSELGDALEVSGLRLADNLHKREPRTLLNFSVRFAMHSRELPRTANEIKLEVMDPTPEQVAAMHDGGIAGRLLDLCTAACATTGFVSIGPHVEGSTWEAANLYNGIYWPEWKRHSNGVGNNGSECLRGVHWANILSEHHYSVIRGRGIALEDLPDVQVARFETDCGSACWLVVAEGPPCSDQSVPAELQTAFHPVIPPTL